LEALPPNSGRILLDRRCRNAYKDARKRKGIEPCATLLQHHWFSYRGAPPGVDDPTRETWRCAIQGLFEAPFLFPETTAPAGIDD
jgi:hypothetical protein